MIREYLRGETSRRPLQRLGIEQIDRHALRQGATTETSSSITYPNEGGPRILNFRRLFDKLLSLSGARFLSHFVPSQISCSYPRSDAAYKKLILDSRRVQYNNDKSSVYSADFTMSNLVCGTH